MCLCTCLMCACFRARMNITHLRFGRLRAWERRTERVSSTRVFNYYCYKYLSCSNQHYPIWLFFCQQMVELWRNLDWPDKCASLSFVSQLNEVFFSYLTCIYAVFTYESMYEWRMNDVTRSYQDRKTASNENVKQRRATDCPKQLLSIATKWVITLQL